MSTPTWQNHSEEYLRSLLNPRQHQSYPMVGDQIPNHLLGMTSDYSSGNISFHFPMQLPLYGMHQIPMLQREMQPAWYQAALFNSYISAGLLAPHSQLPPTWHEVTQPVNRVIPPDANKPATSGMDLLAAAAEVADGDALSESTRRETIEV